MRLNFTSLLIAVVLTLFGATTAQAQTFVTYAEQSTPASEIETGNYVIKTKWKNKDPRWLCVNNSSYVSFCESLDQSSLKNVWRVEKKDDGSFYMMNLGTAAYIKLGGTLTATSADGLDLTLTNSKSSAVALSVHEAQTEGGTTKIDDNTFSLAAGAPNATGNYQHLHIYGDTQYNQAKISSWQSTNGTEKFAETQTFVQFAFYKAELDYTSISGVPTLANNADLYYLQGANDCYLRWDKSSSKGYCTNDKSAATPFYLKPTDDNRYEIWTDDDTKHLTLSNTIWFMNPTDADGNKVYFTLSPTSAEGMFTIGNVSVNSNVGNIQYLLNATNGNTPGKGTDPTASSAYWKFVPANEAATAAASLTANVQTGDAVHGNVTTFSASYPVAIPTGYKAYTANYDNSQNVINVTELAGNVIPANTGVLLRGDVNASLSMKPTMQTGTAVEGNVLTAVGDAAKTFESTDDKIYLLGKQDGTLCFRHMSTNGTQTIAAHKAYINLSDLSTTELSTLRIRFDGETTGINEVSTAVEGIDNGIYDLSGRRVSQPTHGIYIKGGKKVIL